MYSLATRLGLAGWVGNDVDGVFAEVEGPAGQIRDFLAALERDAPPLARVERVSAQPIAPDGRPGFAIVASDTSGRRRALVSADSATCADCLRELADPADRRFGYPFINCTNCGPRFTIVRDVPYDRPLTTMAGFTMCAACAAEYHDPGNRRFHAQPVCCPACGPRLQAAGRGRDRTVRPGRGPGRGGGRAGRRAGAGREGPRRLPPGGGRSQREGRAPAAGPQAPRGQAVRGDGRGPGRGARALRGGRHRGPPADQPPPADRAAAPPHQAGRRPAAGGPASRPASAVRARTRLSSPPPWPRGTGSWA